VYSYSKSVINFILKVILRGRDRTLWASEEQKFEKCLGSTHINVLLERIAHLVNYWFIVALIIHPERVSRRWFVILWRNFWNCVDMEIILSSYNLVRVWHIYISIIIINVSVDLYSLTQLDCLILLGCLIKDDSIIIDDLIRIFIIRGGSTTVKLIHSVFSEILRTSSVLILRISYLEIETARWLILHDCHGEISNVVEWSGCSIQLKVLIHFLLTHKFIVICFWLVCILISITQVWALPIFISVEIFWFLEGNCLPLEHWNWIRA